ncbi:hypothetical protein B1748_07685 [Paenibacillus sp. MY03]|uniref:GerAB/ArcD/ProY family transporter n=1 Tax=Paenibacillus sp. MY03 TaxID=302980 RepID=UPI000B3D2C0B|nr:GerAB/ArcD/ProY family transporter [Paenibacillus sp. MY03]OUS77664.1 hypothetical protein B1748_07685 [Paenibacillus sp. MY03]
MKEKLYPVHIAIMVYMIQTGVVMFSLPRIMAEVFGYNGWLMVPVFTLIAALNIGLIAVVYRLSQGRSVFEILERSLTKVGAYPLYLVLIAVWSLLGCMVAKHYVYIFQTMAFPTTHPMLFKLLIDIVTFLLLIKGIYNISKATMAFFVLTIWMGLLLLFFGPNFEFARLTPFLLKGGTETIRSGLNGYSAFLGYELTLLLFPYVKAKKGFIKAVHAGNLLTGVLYTLYAFVAFGFYSLGQLTAFRFPMLDMLSYIRLPFVERIETLFFGFFFFTVLITIVLYIWASTEALNRMFPKAESKLLAAALLIVIYGVSWLPDTLSKVEIWLKWLGYGQVIIAIGLPVFLILILLIQRRKEQGHA